MITAYRKGSVILGMAKTSLTRESQFTVGENKLMSYVMAVLFLALFVYGVVDASLRHFKNIDYQSYVFLLALVPVIYCLKRARSGRVHIRINKKGIYQDERLVTDWAHLLDAHVTQKEVKWVSIQDNFILVLEYTRENKGMRRSIPLSNSQNKSDEEVLAAVKFFWNEYRKKG